MHCLIRFGHSLWTYYNRVDSNEEVGRRQWRECIRVDVRGVGKIEGPVCVDLFASINQGLHICIRYLQIALNCIRDNEGIQL